MKALRGQRALITGASKRLGAAMAKALARQGMHVILHYFTGEEAAEALAEEIQRDGGAAEPVQMDLMDSAYLDILVKSCAPLDILINNASIFDEISFEEATHVDIQLNMTINAIAPMLLARCFAAQQRPGTIINMLDTMVMDYDKKHVPYHLSKRTLHTLTRIMAVEFAPLVRVNAIAPGLILPPPGKDERYLEELAHSNPLQCHGGADDIVDALLYLLTAEFVTGQTLFVDGGRHLRGSMYE